LGNPDVVTRTDDPLLDRVTPALAAAPGVAAVVLGGSRARGTATDSSDYDLGLYFHRRRPIDAEALLGAVRPLVDDPEAATVTPVGEWGPWIVGGGWLRVTGRKVDILYREIEAVDAVITDATDGRISMHYQPGHSHGFCSAHWMGEVALCRPLHDPDRAVAALKARTQPYPQALSEALIGRFLWEVGFSIENTRLGAARGDATHVAGCAYRALCCAAQVLFALNARYLINEKAAIEAAQDFPITLPDLSARVEAVWETIGRREFEPAFDILQRIDTDLRAHCAGAWSR
jgi:hypothetical protein